jgi:hypothetical protein
MWGMTFEKSLAMFSPKRSPMTKHIHGVTVDSAVVDAMNKLGFTARDRVTGRTGTITHVGFDLYGSVQVILTPPYVEAKPDTEQPGSGWFDMKRLEITSEAPVMETPEWFKIRTPDVIGGFEKPLK